MNEHPIIALPQGYRVQEYELVRVLGFGGFGVTYLGYDHNLDKPVAIKEFLPTDIAVRTDRQSVAPQASTFREDFNWGLERFLDEARTLARFDHRNVIKVYRYFEAHGTAYIVMEYAEGETLADFLSRKGTVNEAELKRVLMPILDGLETVHGADFLHRDIKPSNIVIRDEDASPVLLDFGAARHAVSARSRSVTTIVTPGYAPIEQYSSRGKQGPWTDIYALGAVCYKALTGENPVDSIDRLTDDPLVSVVKQCADKVDNNFLKGIDWALNVKEVDRPQSITSWEAAISTAVPKPAKTTPPVKLKSRPEGTQTKMTRSQWVMVIVFLAFTISGIVTAIYHESEQKAEEARLVEVEEARLAAAEAERQRQARAAEEARLAAAKAERVRQTTRSRYITVGSPRDDVLRLQGTPSSSFSPLLTLEKLLYGIDEFSIDSRTKTVTTWNNRSGDLKVRLHPGNQVTRSSYITVGTHRDDVLRLQGTPSSFSTQYNSETLSYGIDYFSIDSRTKTVTRWNNWSGDLKVRLRPGNQVTRSSYITVGTHRDDVLRLQGTPSSLWTLNYSEILSYGIDYFFVDRRTKKVTSWSNRSGNLKVRLRPGN